MLASSNTESIGGIIEPRKELSSMGVISEGLSDLIQGGPVQARGQNSPWSSTKGYKCGYHEHNINVVFMIGQYLIVPICK